VVSHAGKNSANDRRLDIVNIWAAAKPGHLVRFIDGFAVPAGFQTFSHSRSRASTFRQHHEVFRAGWVRGLGDELEIFPGDILAIDVARAQLSGSLSAFTELGITRPRSFRLPRREKNGGGVCARPRRALALSPSRLCIADCCNMWAE